MNCGIVEHKYNFDYIRIKAVCLYLAGISGKIVSYLFHPDYLDDFLILVSIETDSFSSIRYPFYTKRNTNFHIVPVARLEAFRALKLSRLESFLVRIII